MNNYVRYLMILIFVLCIFVFGVGCCQYTNYIRNNNLYKLTGNVVIDCETKNKYIIPENSKFVSVYKYNNVNYILYKNNNKYFCFDSKNKTDILLKFTNKDILDFKTNGRKYYYVIKKQSDNGYYKELYEYNNGKCKKIFSAKLFFYELLTNGNIAIYNHDKRMISVIINNLEKKYKFSIINGGVWFYENKYLITACKYKYKGKDLSYTDIIEKKNNIYFNCINSILLNFDTPSDICQDLSNISDNWDLFEAIVIVNLDDFSTRYIKHNCSLLNSFSFDKGILYIYDANKYPRIKKYNIYNNTTGYNYGLYIGKKDKLYNF